MAGGMRSQVWGLGGLSDALIPRGRMEHNLQGQAPLPPLPSAEFRVPVVKQDTSLGQPS